MGKIFQCPHCKSEEGYWGEIQVIGYVRTIYNNKGLSEGSRKNLFTIGEETYTCVGCRRDVTPDVNKFLGEGID